MIHDERDLDALARTLWGEARGEPRPGRIAVAWAIRNRAERSTLPFFAGALKGQPGAVHRVCHAPWQFSCWNESDPNRVQILALGPAQLAAERALAAQILDDAVPDPTGGADHYHTIARPGWAAEWPPAWARDYRETVRIGGHVFYDSTRHA